MAKDAIVSDDLAKKFATEKDSPYVRWVRGEGLDIISAHYVPDLNTVELKPWARRGGRGVFINHEASRTSNDCYVCEIPAGKELAPQRQLFEEMILVLSGHGSTSVWNDAGAEGDLRVGTRRAVRHPAQHLAPALQRFRHAGGPVRLVDEHAAGAQPLRRRRVRLQHRPRLPGRFAGEPDYFAPKDEQDGLLLKTNFVANAVNLPLISAKERGAGGGAHPLLDGEGLDEQPHLAVPAPPPTRRGTGTVPAPT